MREPTPHPVIERIRSVIAELALKDYEFADRAGIHPVHLCRMLTNKRSIGKHARRGIIAASDGRLSEDDFARAD